MKNYRILVCSSVYPDLNILVGYVCVCVCVYVCIYIYIYICIYIYIYIYIYMCVCVYIYICSCVSLPDRILHLTSSEECFQITLDMMC